MLLPRRKGELVEGCEFADALRLLVEQMRVAHADGGLGRDDFEEAHILGRARLSGLLGTEDYDAKREVVRRERDQNANVSLDKFGVARRAGLDFVGDDDRVPDMKTSISASLRARPLVAASVGLPSRRKATPANGQPHPRRSSAASISASPCWSRVEVI